MALVDAAVPALRFDVVLLNVGAHWSRDWLPAIAGGVERRLGAAHAVCVSRGIDLDLHLLDRAASGATRQLLLTSVSAQDDGGLGQTIERGARAGAGQVDGQWGWTVVGRCVVHGLGWQVQGP